MSTQRLGLPIRQVGVAEMTGTSLAAKAATLETAPDYLKPRTTEKATAKMR